MKTYLNSFFFLLFIAIIASSCKEDRPPNCEAIGCTEEFRTIMLTFTDTDGAPVIFDEYYTFIDSRNRFKVEKDDVLNGKGNYPVATDAQLDQLSFEGTILIFVGEIDGQNVVEHQLLIGKDCCHIELISGETEIVID